MNLRDFVSWEPINLTNIIMTFGVLFLIALAYGKELDRFMSNLGSVELDFLSGKVTLTSHPEVKPLSQVPTDFDATFSGTGISENFGKSTISELENSMEGLSEKNAVLNFDVNGGKNYYTDKLMFKYLSIASQKVKYLAFVDDGIFKGAIEIENVISGIAKEQDKYTGFGEKLNNGGWQNFPALINTQQVFNQQPTLKELYEALKANGRDALPLVKNQTLVGFLSYQSIADDLYKQAISLEAN